MCFCSSSTSQRALSTPASAAASAAQKSSMPRSSSMNSRQVASASAHW
jgi:hypothetical protein